MLKEKGLPLTVNRWPKNKKRKTTNEKRPTDDEHRITIIEQRLPNIQITKSTFNQNTVESKLRL